MKMPFNINAWLVVILLLSAGPHTRPAAAEIEIAEIQQDEPVDFESQIMPIIRRNCLACHNSTDPESDLVLETPETMQEGGFLGPAVVPHDVEDSLLLQVSAHREFPIMPPANNDVGAEDLTPEELGLIKLWIEQGAPASATKDPETLQWQALPPGINPVYSIALSEDGRYLAAGRANQIFMYHLPTQRELGRLTDPALVDSGLYGQPGVAHLDVVQSLAFDPQANVLVSGGFRKVKIWRRPENVTLWQQPSLGAGVEAIAVHHGQNLAALGLANGSIRLMDLNSGEAIRSLEAHEAAVSGLDFSADGTMLVSAQDRVLRLWNVEDGEPIDQWEAVAEVLAVAFVWEDRQVASGHADHTIRLWDLQPDESEEVAETPQEETEGGAEQAARLPVAELAGHNNAITSLAVWGERHEQLVSASLDSTARLWNVETGQNTRTVDHGGSVVSVAVQPGGERIATASDNGTVKLWNAADGQQIAEIKGDFRAALEVERHQRISGLAQRNVELARQDLEEAKQRREEEVNNLQTAEEERKEAEQALKEKTAEAEKAEDEQEQAAAEELAAAELAFDAADRSVNRLRAAVEHWREETSRREQLLQQAERVHEESEAQLQAIREAATQRERPIRAVAFSSDGRLLAAGGDAQLVLTWDAESGQALERFEGHQAPVGAVAFTADGQLLSAGADQLLSAWQLLTPWQLERTIGEPDSAEAFVDRVTALAISRDGKLLATGSGEPSRSGQLKIWNLKDGTLVREIDEPHSDTIFGIQFSPDDKYLATCGADRFLKTFEVSSGRLVRAFEGHTHHVLDVAWSADGRTLASGSADHTVKVWDVRTGEQQRTIEGFGKEVTGVEFLADTSQVVASCGDNTVYVKRTEDGGNVHSLTGGTDFMYSAAATADGQLVAAGSMDSVVRVWSAEGQVFATFEPPPAEEPAASGQ